MTTPDLNAAREAAKTLKAMPVMPGVGLAIVALIHDLADYVLSLPTPAQSVAEAAGIALPVYAESECLSGDDYHATWDEFYDANGRRLGTERILAALNAPASPVVAGPGGKPRWIGFIEMDLWRIADNWTYQMRDSMTKKQWEGKGRDFGYGMEILCDRLGNPLRLPLAVPTPPPGEEG